MVEPLIIDFPVVSTKQKTFDELWNFDDILEPCRGLRRTETLAKELEILVNRRIFDVFRTFGYEVPRDAIMAVFGEQSGYIDIRWRSMSSTDASTIERFVSLMEADVYAHDPIEVKKAKLISSIMIDRDSQFCRDELQRLECL